MTSDTNVHETPRGGRTTHERDIETTDEVLSPRSRVSWGAIFAGTALALTVSFVLGLFGAAIGLASFDPATEQNPLGGFTTGAGVWLVVQIIISLFAGGWATAHLAGKPRNIDGMLNSSVVWALTVLLTAVGFAAFSSAVISGTATVIKEGVSAVGSAAGAVGGMVDDADIQMQRGQVVSTIQQEARQLLQQTQKQQLQPQELQQEAAALQQLAIQTGRDVATAPQQTGQIVSQAIDRVFRQVDGAVNAADREALVNILVARTNYDRQQAREVVNNWANTYQSALGGLQNLGQNVVGTAETVATDVTDTIAEAMWWSLFGIVLGLIAAVGGGWLGSPSRKEVRHRRDLHRRSYVEGATPTT